MFTLTGGADPLIRNEMCVTPLHSAAMNGDKDCVEILLQYGADPDAVDGDGKTPLIIARESGFGDIADILKKSMLDKHKRELESKGVINWTADDVSEWVEAIGYPQYRNQFHHHKRERENVNFGFYFSSIGIHQHRTNI